MPQVKSDDYEDYKKYLKNRAYTKTTNSRYKRFKAYAEEFFGQVRKAITKK